MNTLESIYDVAGESFSEADELPISMPMSVVPAIAVEFEQIGATDRLGGAEAQLPSQWMMNSFAAKKTKNPRSYLLRCLTLDFKESLLEYEVFSESGKVDIRPAEKQRILINAPKVFWPSKQLFHLYLESMQWLRDSPYFDSVSALSDSNVEKEFSRSIVAFFTSLAQEQRHENKLMVELTKSGRWVADIQIRVSERFFVVPDLCERFLSALLRDIFGFIKSGGAISGDWGSFYITRSGDLAATLSPRKGDRRPKFKKATRLE